MLLHELVEALALIGRSRCDLGQCDQVTLRFGEGPYPLACRAHEPGEFAAEYQALDRVSDAALRSPAELPRVVAVLGAVLLGKPNNTIEDFRQLTGPGEGGISRLHLAETESRGWAVSQSRDALADADRVLARYFAESRDSPCTTRRSGRAKM